MQNLVLRGVVLVVVSGIIASSKLRAGLKNWWKLLAAVPSNPLPTGKRGRLSMKKFKFLRPKLMYEKRRSAVKERAEAPAVKEDAHKKGEPQDTRLEDILG